MSVIEYFGHFGKDGRVVSSTSVTIECPSCRIRRNVRYADYAKRGDRCQVCSRLGPPVYEDEVLRQFPNIIEIVKRGSRGDIVGESVVLVSCANCPRLLQIPFKEIKHDYRCKGCSNSNNYKIRKPKKRVLPDFIVGYDENTLGVNGAIIWKTVVYTKCAKCNFVSKKLMKSVEFQDSINQPCLSCLHSKTWENEDFRKKMHELGILRGKLSGLHIDVKAAMLEYGIAGFESEQWAERSIRVDELNKELGIVLEAYGDWWHLNPRKFNANDEIFRENKHILVGEIWERDRLRIKKLTDHGYAVYIIWEMDFRADPERSIQEFAEWLDDLASIKTGPLFTTA